ncbi:ABC transporter permease/substrate-binding protein [Edaphobacillus lindanitolerans]|uniref:Osmoprotectant transport system permease protein n=1 Tax=Edaphobacillus lindanitolerans TaxID=550447 RepID=A0A1U7PQM6_9BACI|nr:ABC transporter permease/substrate-binding protein [Edaphobacillus lindanitolerans]SIT84361.1 osmoprotectant transport system permease protein [Edaphobacillus lindanitolerans]
MAGLMDEFSRRQGELWTAVLQHMEISFVSLIIAVLIAVPLGIWLTRHVRAADSVIGVTSVIQTIPSLALLGLLIPIVGIGRVPAIIALTAYALLPILRNTYTGIREVDPALVEAANAMGMNGRRRLRKVELPLAMPVIMAGIRTATVLIIGTATLAALIGAGGLGDLILLGIDRNNANLIVLGAIPAAILALIFDFLLKKLERMPFRKSLIAAGTLALAAAVIFIVPLIGKGDDKLVLAGKLGTEPEILINMYKLLIEEETDLSVELKPGFGKTSFVFNALRSGDIDIYPEFTGTVISEFLKETAGSTDSREVYEQARDGLAGQFGMALLDPMQYNNTYTLAVPDNFAQEHGLETISDLKTVESRVKAGFTLEFSDRKDGYPGIRSTYGITFPDVVTMEPKLRYGAVQNGEINVVDAYSTDSEIERYQLRVLEDDRQLFPPYQGAPLMTEKTARKFPEVVEALNRLAGKITDDEMRKMNYDVAVGGQTPAEVAEQYLKSQGLLGK